VSPVRHWDGCGAGAPWHSSQAGAVRKPEKLLPWQTWQEANPELPGAFFAESPWGWDVAPKVLSYQLLTGPWWHPAGLPKQEVPEVPPERSAPWHSAQELLPPLAM